MKEKLIIKNFGPIKDVELDLGRFNILIGEQATGKSIVARLLNLFKSEGFLFGDTLDQASLLNLYGFFFQDNSHIEYSSDDYDIVLSNGNNGISFKGTHKEILQRFSEISRKFLTGNEFNLESEYYSLKKWHAETIGNGIYIPAERAIINTGYRLIRGGGGAGIEQYLIDFDTDFSRAVVQIKELLIPFLGNVTFKREGAKNKVAFKNELLDLNQASSGFQSSIPLTVVIEYFSGLAEKIHFIIEEPELNLFPKTQNELMKYLVTKTGDQKNRLFIATHSPYTLTSLNNMMYAYNLGKIHEEEASSVIDKKYWLNPDDVSSYMMKTDGSYEDIFDREEGMIKAEMIDGVSEEINEAFDKLLSIEFKKDESDK